MVTPISPAEVIRVQGTGLVPSLSAEDRRILAKWRDLHITDAAIPMDEVRFLVKTRLANWIACFKNSTQSGAVHHTPYSDSNGQMMIPVEGQWTPICEVMRRFQWDAQQQKLHLREDPEVIWSYEGIHGLVPRDRFHYGAMAPVYSLSAHEFKPLLEQSHAFWQTKDERRNSVLQIITTNHNQSGGILPGAVAATTDFEHVTFRLVDKKGQVYSFGVELEEEELDQISGTFAFFKTATAYLSAPDYEEPRRFVKKRVTSLSITEEQLSGIVQFVNALNACGMSFNYLKQNCSTVAREVLHRVGVNELHSSSSLSEYLFRYIREIPGIGETLSDVISKVAAIAAYLPDFVAWIARNAFICCMKTAFVICGALNTTHIKKPLDFPQDAAHLTPFSRLVSSVEDLFDERIDTHFKLIEWQTEQPTTRTYQFQQDVKLYGLIAQ